MTIIIGLAGKARHGKGSVVQFAQILRQKGDEELEIKQVSFATALKQMTKGLVLTLQGKPPVDWDGEEHTYEDVARYHLVDLGLPLEIANQVVDLARGLTVQDLKDKTPGGRKLLQFIGTEAFRRNVDDLYWVKKAAEKISTLPPETEIAFIPDCRFTNEADYVRKVLGGQVWRVERYTAHSWCGPRNDIETYLVPFDNGLTPEQKAHPSETQLDDYQYDRILKAANMDDLFHAVEAELQLLQKDGKL